MQQYKEDDKVFISQENIEKLKNAMQKQFYHNDDT